MNVNCQNCASEVQEGFQFCPNCGNVLSDLDIIAHYFMRGFEYLTILALLSKFHNIEMSFTNLKQCMPALTALAEEFCG